MACANQAQHAACALEFFERPPARVELIEQLGMDRIGFLQLAPIVLVRAALREVVGVRRARHVVEGEHRVGLAATEVGLQFYDRITAGAGEPLGGADQKRAQALGQIGAVKN
jgi:hypothetical protein